MSLDDDEPDLHLFVVLLYSYLNLLDQEVVSLLDIHIPPELFFDVDWVVSEQEVLVEQEVIALYFLGVVLEVNPFLVDLVAAGVLDVLDLLELLKLLLIQLKKGEVLNVVLLVIGFGGGELTDSLDE